MYDKDRKETNKKRFPLKYKNVGKKHFALTNTTNGISMSFKYFFPIANMAFFGQNLRNTRTFI